MSVYVDNERMPYGRMLMCHMLADTTEELLAMADKIGVRRKWLQHAGTPKEHFDICLSKRAIAIQHGALEAGREKVVELVRSKRAQQEQPKCRDCGVFVDKSRWVNKESYGAIHRGERPLCNSCWSEYDYDY